MPENAESAGSGEKLVIVQFYDQDGESEAFLAETELSEAELRDLVGAIINDFLKEENYEWTYEDIIQELENRRAIRTIEVAGYYRSYA